MTAQVFLKSYLDTQLFNELPDDTEAGTDSQVLTDSIDSLIDAAYPSPSIPDTTLEFTAPQALSEALQDSQPDVKNQTTNFSPDNVDLVSLFVERNQPETPSAIADSSSLEAAANLNSTTNFEAVTDFSSWTALGSLPTDPLFSSQWHLNNNTAGLLDLNVVDVWADYTGAGVDVAVIDDAVQRTHPDLDGNYSTLKDWDFEDGDTNASGFNSDNHGTAVAGIIAAEEGNNIGGVGVAYDATIFGFRGLFLSNITDAINNASGQLETNGINREADVVNMSFGTKSFFSQSSTRASADDALTNAALYGRDSLGTILVKSAGNARTDNQDTNSRLLNANRHTVTVAAVDQDGFVSSYSNHGASVLVSAFGTPKGNAGEVVTTDRVGTAGKNPFGDYRFDFNGTSAAAPMVSGVVALMLEANPDLGWRDVQDILAYSARHVGTNVGFGTSGDEEYAWSFNGADNWNGGGLHFSNDYGFGLVDAKAAVRLAETWDATAETSANEATVFRDFLNSAVTISTTGTSFSQYIGSNIDIESVEVDINFTQWYDLGDLELRLTSPDGTTSVLIDGSGEDNGSASGGFTGRWEFFSHAFRGEDTVGTWTVQVFDGDNSSVSPITINDIDLTFKGDTFSYDDTFVFTNEYSEYAGTTFGHSTAIAGGFGGDTVNAAAVDSDTVLDLLAGTGQIDGVNVSLSSIENAYTGDGDDSLRGNTGSNQLSGMRGNDMINGEAGADNISGGQGNDLLIGGSGTDAVQGGDGDDFLVGVNPYAWNAGDSEYDILTGGKGADVFALGDAFQAYYDGWGYATITDFNWGEGDSFQAFGSQADYSLGWSNWVGSSVQDTLIYFQDNLVGVVQDFTSVSLSLDFTYV